MDRERMLTHGGVQEVSNLKTLTKVSSGKLIQRGLYKQYRLRLPCSLRFQRILYPHHGYLDVEA
jgi:hypothetical protein